MNVVSFEDVGRDDWDAFCAASPDAWLRHTSQNIEYALTLGNGSVNHSFALVEGKRILALVPLQAQAAEAQGKRVFAVGGSPIPFPAFAPELSPKEHAHAAEAVFAEIDRLAQEHTVAYIRMFVDPLTDPITSGRMRVSPLPSFGYHDTSIATVSIDLSLSEGDIFKGIAERRRRYIAAAMRDDEYVVDFFDAENITDEIFAQFTELYFAAAGKTVGTPERWEKTLGFIKDGLGLLVLVRKSGEEEYSAGHFISIYGHRAYDGLSAIRPLYKDQHDIGIFMQWRTIVWLRDHDFTRYEIGLLYPPTISESVYTEKELAISHFKELFGGEVLPLFRGEKYYDMDYLRMRREELTEAFIAQHSPEIQ